MPNCLTCHKAIKARHREYAQEFSKRKFCNHSCAASYTNKQKPKRPVPSASCKRCGSSIILKKQKSGAYSPRRFCSKTCASEVLNRTKEKLKQVCTGRNSWRVAIQAKARQIYLTSDLPKKCLICNYSTYIEVCHRRPVADFPDETVIAVINHKDNLIALCPTHHWELDHGHLVLN